MTNYMIVNTGDVTSASNMRLIPSALDANQCLVIIVIFLSKSPRKF